MRNRSTLQALLLIPCLLIISGCAAQKYSQLPDPIAPSQRRGAVVKVMEQMDERRLAINHVAVKMLVTLQNENGKEFNLDGVYLGDGDGNFRLRILREQAVIADLAIYDDVVELLLPKKDRFYRMNRQDVQKVKGKIALLAHIGNAHDLFFPRAWTPNAVERRWKLEDGYDVIYVRERNGLFKKDARRIVLSSKDPVPEMIEVFDRHASLLGTVSYNDYRFPAPRAGAAASDPTGGVAYPGSITISPPKGNEGMRLEVIELNPNFAFTVDRLKIQRPEGVRIRTLEDAMRSEKEFFQE